MRHPPGRVVALLGSAAVWLVVAGPPGNDPVARWIGMLTFHLVAAALIRWLYIRVQKPRPRVVSPTMFLIAAGVALLGRFGPSA